MIQGEEILDYATYKKGNTITTLRKLSGISTNSTFKIINPFESSLLKKRRNIQTSTELNFFMQNNKMFLKE